MMFLCPLTKAYLNHRAMMSLDCFWGEDRSTSNALCDRLGTRPWDLVCGRLDIFAPTYPYMLLSEIRSMAGQVYTPTFYLLMPRC